MRAPNVSPALLFKFYCHLILSSRGRNKPYNQLKHIISWKTRDISALRHCSPQEICSWNMSSEEYKIKQTASRNDVIYSDIHRENQIKPLGKKRVFTCIFFFNFFLKFLSIHISYNNFDSKKKYLKWCQRSEVQLMCHKFISI